MKWCRSRERLSLVDDPARYRHGAIGAGSRNHAVHDAPWIEKALPGLQGPIGLPPDLEDQRAFEHVAGFIARVRVKPDGGARRQRCRADHDFLSRNTRLIVTLEYGPDGLWGSVGFIGGRIREQRCNGGEITAGTSFIEMISLCRRIDLGKIVADCNDVGIVQLLGRGAHQFAGIVLAGALLK